MSKKDQVIVRILDKNNPTIIRGVRALDRVDTHKIGEDVYLLPWIEGKEQPGHEFIQKYENTRPYHKCHGEAWLTEMVFRDNNEGPMYWCMGCGYTLEEGVSMAVRLNEVEI